MQVNSFRHITGHRPTCRPCLRLLPLLPMTDSEKDVEILTPRHQLTLRQRRLDDQHLQLQPKDRAFLAALLVPLARRHFAGQGAAVAS